MRGQGDSYPILVGDGYDEQRLLTAKEVGAILGVPFKRVYTLPIPRVRLSRRCLRFRWKDLLEFIERRTERI